MKKIIIIATLLVVALQTSASVDTLGIIKKALDEIGLHPKELTDSQAIDLYLNPGKADTVRTNNSLMASKFSFLPLPYNKNWVLKGESSVFWYQNGWQRGPKIISFFEPGAEIIAFLHVILAIIVLALPFITLSERWSLNNRIKEKEYEDDKKRVIANWYWGNYKKSFIFRSGIAILLIAFVTVVFQIVIVFSSSNPLLWATITWWFLLAWFIGYCMRRILITMTFKTLGARYPHIIKETVNHYKA